MQATFAFFQSDNVRAWQRKIWRICQHELLYLTHALMEVALITPIALSYMPWVSWQPGWVLVALLLLMLLPFNLIRQFSLRELPAEQQQNLMAIMLLLTAFLALHFGLHRPAMPFDLRWIGRFFWQLADFDNLSWLQDVSLFLLIVLIWWRGVRLSQRDFTITSIGLRLRGGGLLLAPVVVWTGRRLAWDVSPYLLLFFIAALTAVALVRVEELEKERTGLSANFNLRWLLSILATALLICMLGTILAILITGQAATAVIGWLAPVWSALAFGWAVILGTLLYVGQPLLLLLELVIRLLTFLIQQLFKLVNLENLQLLGGLLELIAEIEGQATESSTAAAGPSLGARLIVILLLVSTVLLAAWGIRRLHQRAAIQDSDRLVAPAEGKKGAGNGRLRQRLRNPFARLRQWRTARSIRRIYRNMTQLATEFGYPRRENETPYEYLGTLAQAWPQQRTQTRIITESFVKIRYGEYPETAAELDIIRHAWHQIQRAEPPLQRD